MVFGLFEESSKSMEGEEMILALREIKNWLRVDHDDDDELITNLTDAAERLCAAVARMDPEEFREGADEYARTAVLYCVAYLYEHREEADHHALTLSLRSLLFGIRKDGF